MSEQFKPPPRSLDERVADLERLAVAQHQTIVDLVKVVGQLHATDQAMLKVLNLLAGKPAA